MVEIFLCILNDFISVNNVPKSLLTLASDNFWIIVWIMPKIVKAHSNKIARLKPSLVKYDFLPVLTSFAASFVISKTSIFTKKNKMDENIFRLQGKYLFSHTLYNETFVISRNF